GEAADGLETLRQVEKLKPDVLLLDLMLPKLHGLEVARQLKQKRQVLKIVILSMHSEELWMLEALRNGADGYVVKTSSGVDLIQAIRKVLSGRRHFNDSLTDRVLTGYLARKDETSELYDKLSNRERTVLQL